MAGETVDVFFVAPKKLFEGLPEWTFVYGFIAELSGIAREDLYWLWGIC